MRMIGIDLGIRKIALVLLNSSVAWECFPAVHEASVEDPRDVQLAELGRFARDAALLHHADSVWIEDSIIGNNRKYSIRLAETKGAVMSYLSQLRLAEGVDVRLVDNKTWKREVVGNGNADKEAVRNHIHDMHPAYAAVCGDDQDLYDASCVALYGLQIMARAKHLQL